MEPGGEFFFKGPDFDFDFAVNDALIFNLYSYRILVFKIDDLESLQATTENLKIGLQRLVERCPPLGGVIAPIENKQGGWKKALPGPGIKLVVRDLRDKLNYQHLEAKDFPPDMLKCADTIPISPAPVMEGEAPGSVFQYSWITGGALLTVGIDHPIADGNGMNTIMGILAGECKRANETSTEFPVIGTDRSMVRALENKTKNRPEDHSSYEFLPEPPSHDDHGPEPNISMFMFQITPTKLEGLKQLASKENPRVSSHDAMSALTWRAAMLSRQAAGTISGNPDVEFHCPTDARRFVGLDRDYIGNMVYYVTCKMPLEELLKPDNLPKTAALIRSTLEARDRDLIAGYHSLCKTLKDLGQMTFGWIPTMKTTSFAMGSSWKANQMYGADWGNAFGPVMRFRSPDVGFFGVFEGLTFICPKVQGTGPAEFQCWFEPEGWEAVQKDDLFTKLCTRIGV